MLFKEKFRKTEKGNTVIEENGKCTVDSGYVRESMNTRNV